MLEILKKAGLASGIATLIVLLITAAPIWYQYKTTAAQNAVIAELEKKVDALTQQVK